MKIIKIPLQLLLFLCPFNFALAQTEDINWKFLQAQDSVSLHFSVSTCGPEKKLLLMVVNTDTTPKRVQVKLQLIDSLTPQDLPEGVFHVPAQGVVVLSCNNKIPHLQPLQVNVLHDDASLTVSSFEIDNL